MKNTFLLISIISLSFTHKTFAQKEINLAPLSQTEKEKLQMEAGCGCVISDVNPTNETYLYGEHDIVATNDLGISEFYLKINGKLEKFQFIGQEFKMSFRGDGGGNFDLFFSKKPNDNDILKGLKEYNSNFEESGIVPDGKNSWISGGAIGIYTDGNIDEYFLLDSGNYIARLFIYTTGNSVEGIYKKGEAFILSKENEWVQKSISFILDCGC